ncbi:MAG: hypothetical protein VYE73_02295 [Acidobacteriota bacterium]|nr:hypothetical protein [Acidobacteriota bacterium]
MHDYLPEPFRLAPQLTDEPTEDPHPKTALLPNPFYAKDPHASFGKHVLTPTLALTSIAGATPAGWTVAYWDENLLQGPPPLDPVPEVVGITVHLTFARRAYELAAHYRAHGSKIVLGGLHVLSCPEEAMAHADAIAVGDGVQIWPRMLEDIAADRLEQRYDADYARPYSDDPPPPARSGAEALVSDHHQPHRHAWLPQSVRLLLLGDRGAAHALSHARSGAGRR